MFSDGLFGLVELFQQFVGLVGVFVAHQAGDVVFQLFAVAAQDDVFDGEQIDGVHGEGAQPEPEQQSREAGVACHFAA